MRWPWETKTNPVGSVISAWGVGQPIWTDRRYEKLAEESYVWNAIAFKCTKLISQSAAMTPWLLTGKGGKEIEEHDLLTLLSRPAPMIGGHSLFEAFYAYLLLSGSSYLVGETLSSKRPPKELWTLRPDRTKVVAGPNGIPSGYEYEASGQKRTFRVDPITGEGDILHVKEFHPINDWYGLGRAEPAATAIDRHNASSAHNVALLQNGARPTGALIFKPVKGEGGAEQSAPPAVIAAAQEELEARHGGPRRAGKPFVFGGNVEWKEMGLSPRDMDFSKGKEDAARDICTAFGVPHLLIVPGSDTYSNKAQASLELWEDTILPLLDKTTDALNAWLVPRFGDGLRLGVDLDEVSALEPRRASKRTSTIELVKVGILSEDEGRAALQYDKRPPSDVKKVDPATLKALMDGAKAGTAQLEPLYRYQMSVGLLPPDKTLEDFMAEFEADGLDPDEDEAQAAQLPVSGADPELDAAEAPPAEQIVSAQ